MLYIEGPFVLHDICASDRISDGEYDCVISLYCAAMFQGATLLMMGSADELPTEPAEKPIFVEDMSDSQLAKAVSSLYRILLSNFWPSPILINPNYHINSICISVAEKNFLSTILIGFLIGTYVGFKFL